MLVVKKEQLELLFQSLTEAAQTGASLRAKLRDKTNPHLFLTDVKMLEENGPKWLSLVEDGKSSIQHLTDQHLHIKIYSLFPPPHIVRGSMSIFEPATVEPSTMSTMTGGKSDQATQDNLDNISSAGSDGDSEAHSAADGESVVQDIHSSAATPSIPLETRLFVDRGMQTKQVIFVLGEAVDLHQMTAENLFVPGVTELQFPAGTKKISLNIADFAKIGENQISNIDEMF